MAEWICRALRDGGAEGEHAPALTIKDTIRCPLASTVFDHILSRLSSFILSRKSQSKGIVLVAYSRSPQYYEQLLKSKCCDIAASPKWIKILDCYSDPLGWKSELVQNGSIINHAPASSDNFSSCKNVKDLDQLFSLIVESGKELAAGGKERFSVAIDSVSEMLRRTSILSVSAFVTNLRSHDQVSCLFWLLHSDLHETRATTALEYMSSMQASVEPIVPLQDRQKGNSENLSLMKQNFRRGKFCVRVKRRNGRVRMMFEELYVEKSGIKFTSVPSEDEIAAQSLVPKVQFNLELSEKERNDRAKVVLPFEHQGNGKTIQIYDGRKSLNEGKADGHSISVGKVDSSKGEIIYFRDSDDEMPDSDEDPDDDLDI